MYIFKHPMGFFVMGDTKDSICKAGQFKLLTNSSGNLLILDNGLTETPDWSKSVHISSIKKQDGTFYRDISSFTTDISGLFNDIILNSVVVRKHNKSLTGLQNDINTVYTTPDSFVLGSSQVIQNGGILTLGVDYTEVNTSGAGTGVTLTIALDSDAVLRINYDLTT